MAEPDGRPFERAVAFPPLLEAAQPGLYRRNAFRITGLPVDAGGRDVSRRADRLRMMEKLAAPTGEVHGPLPLQPPPDGDAIREALRRLHDPEDRLVDELFWFWSGPADPASQALVRGEIEVARGLWRQREQEPGGSTLVARHDLAVLAHVQALEGEDDGAAAAPELAQQRWSEAMRRWRQLVDDPELTLRLRARLVELADPRLTPATGQAIVASLPSALLAISATLAGAAAERGDVDAAGRHVRHLDLWDAAPPEVDAVEAQAPAPEVPRCAVCDGPVDLARHPGHVWCPACKKTVKQRRGGRRRSAPAPRRSPLVVAALHRCVEPQRQRIKALCASAEAEAERDPVRADGVLTRLLEHTAPLLRVIDTLLDADDLLRAGAHDEVAQKALSCQISYGNKTQNWRRCVELLGPVLGLAAGGSARQRVQDNLDIVRKNAETGGDWCGEGYFELPAPVLEIAERCRARAEVQEWDEAIPPLVGLYMGRSCGELDETSRRVVGQALAAGLNKRALARLKPAMAIASETPAIIRRIAERAERGDHRFTQTAMAARLGLAGQANVEIHCMACGSAIWSRFYRMTFKDIPIIVCPDCNSADDRDRDSRKGRIRSALSTAAEDLVVAADLLPADVAIRENLDGVRKFGSDVGVPLPSVHRTRMQLGLAGLPELLRALREGSTDERRHAADALATAARGRDQVIPALVEALVDGESSVRKAVTSALGKYGADAVPPLLAGLDDARERVREGAREALRGLAASASAEVLTGLTDARPRVRAGVAWAAVGVGSAAVEPLLAALSDHLPEVRAAAAEALGRLGDARALGPLVRQLVDPLVATVAEVALGAIDAAWPSTPAAQAAVPDLATALRAAEIGIRRRATLALGAMGRSAAVAVGDLGVALADADARVRAGAATALANMGSEAAPAVPALTAAVADAEAPVRAAAAAALAAAGDPASIRVLVPLMGDGAEAVRAAALAALERLDRHWLEHPATAAAVPDLQRGLQAVDAAARLATATTLGQMGKVAHAAGATLVAVLHDGHAEVREAAAAALPLVGAPALPAVRGLAALLSDKVAGPRRAAALALAAYGAAARSAGPALAEAAVRDGDGPVREAAFAALGKADPELAAQVVRRRRMRFFARAAGFVLAASLLFSGCTLGMMWRDHRRGVPSATQALHDFGLVDTAEALAALRQTLASATQQRESAAAGTTPVQEVDVLAATRRQRAALVALASLGAAARPAALEIFLCQTDSDELVRKAAEDALRSVAPQYRPGPEDIAPLLAGLGRGGERARHDALVALGRFGSAARDAVPHLAGLLVEGDATLRANVALALDQIDPAWRSHAAVQTEVRPRFEALAQDSLNPARDLASRALQSISPLEGTSWRFTLAFGGEGLFRFQQGGVLEFETGSGPQPGRWRREGEKVLVEGSDYSYTGQFTGESLAFTGRRAQFASDSFLATQGAAGDVTSGPSATASAELPTTDEDPYEPDEADSPSPPSPAPSERPLDRPLTGLAAALVGHWSWNGWTDDRRADGTGSYSLNGSLCFEYRWTLAGDTYTSVPQRQSGAGCGPVGKAAFRVSLRDGGLAVMTHQGSGFESQWKRSPPRP